LPADGRTLFDLAVDVGGLDGAEVLERVEAALVEEGVGAADVVRVTLRGAQPYGARPASALASLSSRVAHLVVRDATAPAPSGEAPAVPTAEGRFFSDLAARLESAPDDASRRALDLAIRLGRDALAGRAVRPPDPERGMRIERIRIAGFGPLADLDLEWPDGRLLLVVDRNERGKTSLCEAIVAALYGVPRGRGAGSRLRELRRRGAARPSGPASTSSRRDGAGRSTGTSTPEPSGSSTVTTASRRRANSSAREGAMPSARS